MIVPTYIKSLSILKLLGTLIILIFALFYLYFSHLRNDSFYTLWLVCYCIGITAIILTIREGILYHPLVIIGSSYVLILVVGSITFPLLHNRMVLAEVFNLVGVGFVGLMGGIFLGTRFQLPAVQLKPRVHTKNTTTIYLFALVGLLSSLYLFISFKGIPILAANPNEAKVRFLVGNGIFNLFFKGLPVFAMALLYVHYKQQQSLLIPHVYCFITILIMLAAGYRSTTLISLGEYAALFLILHRKTIPFRWTVGALLGALLFLAFIGSYRRGNQGLDGAWNELAIVVQARPALFESIVRNFDQNSFFNGSLYYNDFKRFLPGLQVNANVDLKYAIFPNADSMPDIAGVTPSVAGEAYMNFGSKGVFWVLMLLGILLGFSYVAFQRYPSFLRISTYLTFLFGMAGGIQSGIGLKMVHLTQFWFWTILLGILIEREIFFQPNRSMTS